MPVYEYFCENCNNIREEFHSMLDNPVIPCICGIQRIKLVGCGKFIGGMNGGRGVYDFVDYNTTGKPVKINNKRQWQEHLKKHGLNDDVPNDPKNLGKLKDGMINIDKQKLKRETKEAIVKAVKDKKHIREMKQKILNKGGI